jgi:HK97 gp10 family phage protein
MSFITVERSNAGAVTERLNVISDTLKSDKVMAAVNQRMDTYYNNMLATVPVRTGYLRSTIKIQKGQDISQISVSAFYAAYVDRGTMGRRRQPFFTDSLIGASMEIINAIRAIYGFR